MKQNDWDPALYLKYKLERTQPSMDLANRIHVENPRSIFDIGCGPGNSTQILAKKWPESKITGMDNSPAMISKAKKDYPRQDWILMDAQNIILKEKFDLVFSNATIQWLPNHEKMLIDFHNLLTDTGTLAVQMPLFWDMPLGRTIQHIAMKNEWKNLMKGVTDLFTIHPSPFYYKHLSVLFKQVDIWETHYIHIMDSHESILEMISSTGLRPYLDRLTDDNDKQAFEMNVLESIKQEYPVQNDGKVLFPFKRLFFVAYK